MVMQIDTDLQTAIKLVEDANVEPPTVWDMIRQKIKERKYFDMEKLLAEMEASCIIAHIIRGGDNPPKIQRGMRTPEFREWLTKQMEEQGIRFKSDAYLFPTCANAIRWVEKCCADVFDLLAWCRRIKTSPALTVQGFKKASIDTLAAARAAGEDIDPDLEHSIPEYDTTEFLQWVTEKLKEVP